MRKVFIGVALCLLINTCSCTASEISSSSNLGYNIQSSSSYGVIEDEILYPIYYPEVNMYGYENGKGVSILPPKYENARPFSEGMAAVYDGYRWGYINRDGVYVIKPQYGAYNVWGMQIVNPFVNGTAAVYLGNGNVNGFSDCPGPEEYALIDKSGNIVKYFDTLAPSWYGSEGGKVGEYHASLNGKGYLVDGQGNILKQEY